jgi:uncharacterized membrane protein HdeD (DUF308 family)
MLVGLALNWPFLFVRAALAIVFGLVVLMWPGMTSLRLAMLFGFYALADGVLSLTIAISVRDVHGASSLVLDGVVRVIVALYTLTAPASAALKLTDVFTAWAFLAGITAFLVAVALRRDVAGEWPMPFAGAMSILFGVLVKAGPGAPGDFQWVIGPYALFSGFTVFALTQRLRQLAYEVVGSAE